MTYQDFLFGLYGVVWEYKEDYIRDGQALMLYLQKIWPAEYERITATEVDCFYNDDIISNTLNHLEKVWENYPN